MATGNSNVSNISIEVASENPTSKMFEDFSTSVMYKICEINSLIQGAQSLIEEKLEDDKEAVSAWYLFKLAQEQCDSLWTYVDLEIIGIKQKVK